MSSTGVPTPTASDYWPLALYDTREGVKRDESGAIADRYTVVIGGVMYYVELDTTNLAKWFKGAAGFADGVGTLAKNDNNGYIVYFSDRRNNRNASNKETGEFGNEDIINPATAAGTPNNVLDPGEDVNAYVPVAPATYTPVLDTYGIRPSYLGTRGDGATTGVPPCTGACSYSPLGPTAKVNDLLVTGGFQPPPFHQRVGDAREPADLLPPGVEAHAWRYPAHGRHQRPDHRVREPGLRRGQLQRLGPGGLRDRGAHRRRHRCRRDHPAVDQLERHQFVLPHARRLPWPSAAVTSYRFAAVAGKSISFQRSLATGASPAWTPETDFGNDGGAHNLLRMLEDWGAATLHYRGSMVSFYISRQATGIYKSGNYGYSPPDVRDFNFDVDFLLPDKLPPGTPMFRDVNTLTFRQLLRPNQ